MLSFPFSDARIELFLNFFSLELQMMVCIRVSGGSGLAGCKPVLGSCSGRPFNTPSLPGARHHNKKNVLGRPLSGPFSLSNRHLRHGSTWRASTGWLAALATVGDAREPVWMGNHHFIFHLQSANLRFRCGRYVVRPSERERKKKMASTFSAVHCAGGRSREKPTKLNARFL